MNTYNSQNTMHQFKVKCVFDSKPVVIRISTLTAKSSMDAIEQFTKIHSQDIRSITAKAV